MDLLEIKKLKKDNLEFIKSVYEKKGKAIKKKCPLKNFQKC